IGPPTRHCPPLEGHQRGHSRGRWTKSGWKPFGFPPPRRRQSRPGRRPGKRRCPLSPEVRPSQWAHPPATVHRWRVTNVVIVVVGGQRVGGNLSVSPHRVVGRADPAGGRASDAAPFPLRFGPPNRPTHPPLSTVGGSPTWS